MKEEWKYIPGYEKLYKISTNGRVYGCKMNHLMKPTLKSNGYLSISLLDNNGCRRTWNVHRLVGNAFVQNDDPEHKTVINHKNEIKNDNRAENLEWCTTKYNNTYGSILSRKSESMLKYYTTKEGIEQKKMLSEIHTGKKQSQYTINKRVQKNKELNEKLTKEERSYKYMPESHRKTHSEYMKRRMMSLSEMERKQMYGHKLDEDTQNRLKFSRQYGRRFQDLEYVTQYDLKMKNKNLIYDFVQDDEYCPLHESDFQFPIEKGKRGILYFKHEIKNQFDFVEDFEYIN